MEVHTLSVGAKLAPSKADRHDSSNGSLSEFSILLLSFQFGAKQCARSVILRLGCSLTYMEHLCDLFMTIAFDCKQVEHDPASIRQRLYHGNQFCKMKS